MHLELMHLNFISTQLSFGVALVQFSVCECALCVCQCVQRNIRETQARLVPICSSILLCLPSCFLFPLAFVFILPNPVQC